MNIGIKQPINAIIEAAENNRADVIGMSGLLVKSTVVMKENLQELADRGLATKYPILLGGAALTRAYVEQDLAEIFAGEVRYARDAFEGLRLMEAVRAVQKGVAGAELPPLRKRRVTAGAKARVGGGGDAGSGGDGAPAEPVVDTRRSDVATNTDVPEPPFWGSRVVKGVALKDYAGFLDERATFLGQWGLRGSRGDGPSYEELVETEGRPRLRMWLERIATDHLAQAAVTYGYWPAVSEGNSLLVLDPDAPDPDKPIQTFTFPRQRRDRRLCLADFFKPRSSGELDVVAFQLVTMGPELSGCHRGTVRGERLPRVPRAARPVGPAGRVARGVLAPPGAAGARHRHPGAGRRPGPVRRRVPRLPLQLRLPGLPRPRRPGQAGPAAQPDRIGVELSEEFQLHPEQSTDALVVHHPEASYFNAR